MPAAVDVESASAVWVGASLDASLAVSAVPAASLVSAVSAGVLLVAMVASFDLLLGFTLDALAVVLTLWRAGSLVS
jgi:hypothetical protein